MRLFIAVELPEPWKAVLDRAARALAGALDRVGLWMDPKPFRPHLTLGRQVRIREDFDAAAWAAGLPALTCRVDRLTLMRSQRLQGQLAYTPLYRRRLRGI